MEDTTWEERTNALTHILTTPTTTPNLHSQYFISNQIPCYLNWEYPPHLCPQNHFLKWKFSQFLKRVPLTSWRSKCPYYIPTPLVLAKGVEPPKWDDEAKKLYVRKRLHRKPLESRINPWIPFLLPNFFLFSLLLWNPLPHMDDS